MRIVLDTNVIIAAFATRGLCHSVFELCVDRHTIFLGAELLTEIESNLRKKIKLPDAIISEILAYLRDIASLEETDPTVKDICRDADDDKVLGLAKKSNAEYIITGDEDLVLLQEFCSTKIVRPRKFWEILRQSDKK